MEKIHREYKICIKCIMDTSDPHITFDENGICNHCRDYKKKLGHLRSEEDLKKKIEKIQNSGKGKKYDCVIGLSGGVDSSMVAYLVKKFGLRPLALHLDNGWDSELAVSNIEKIVKNLKLDFYTHVINWEEFKNLQLSFLQASVANIEIPTDHAIVALLYNTAAKSKVNYIIHGGNVKSEGIMPRAWGYNSRDLKHLRAIHERFGKLPLKTFPTLGIWKLAYYSLVKKIRYFPILDYVNYDKAKSKEFLKKELGWQDYGVKHAESIFTRFFQCYILPVKFGFDKRKAHLSTLINSGQITREEALEELKKGFYPTDELLKEDKEYVIKKLGLTSEEFKKIMSFPSRLHSDYPNDNLFSSKLVPIYIFIKRLLVR